MRPASFQNPLGVSGTPYERTRFDLNPRMSYFAPEPGAVSPFGGYYAADPEPRPTVMVVNPRARGPSAREQWLEDELHQARYLLARTRHRPPQPVYRDEGPLPERQWFADGYGRESRRYPGHTRHRFKQEGWAKTMDGKGAGWEWCGRAVRAAAPEQKPAETEASRLEKLVKAADARALRAEAAAAARSDALAAEVQAQRRELEALRGGRSGRTPSPRTSAEAAADDAILEAFDALRRENAELRALAGVPQAWAPAPSAA